MVHLWLILSSLLLAGWVQAGPQLYLQNVPLQDEKLLVVSLMLRDMADLYGAEVQIRYDPAQLRVRDENPRLPGSQIAPGPLLAFNDRFVATNDVDQAAGLVNFVFTLIKPATPISGEGALATVVFEMTDDGPFLIEVVNAKLVSSKLEAIPVTTLDLYLTNAQAAAPATSLASSLNFPAWSWWVLGAGGGLMALLLLIRLKPGWLPLISPSTAPALPRRIPGSTPASPRAAALLAEQGDQAFKEGNRQRAYDLFSRAIEFDPASAGAWLGKGLVAQQVTEKRICFQRVLALDPHNERAKTELQNLEPPIGNLCQNL
jgi:hypothetical protein